MILMHILDENSRYNNIASTAQMYDVGQPLLLGVELDTANNTQATYVTITNKGVSISNLEMLRIDDICTINLAPFLQSYWNNNSTFLDSSSIEGSKSFRIDVKNSGEETSKALIITVCGINRSKTKNNSVTEVVTSDWIKPDEIYELDELYVSDTHFNDFSDFLCPKGITVKYQQVFTWFDIYYSIYNKVFEDTILPGQRQIDVMKEKDDESIQAPIKKIVRKEYCKEHNILLAYLNRYGYYEYFVLDTKYISTFSINKNDKIHNTIINNIYNDESIYSGGDYETTINASVMINNDFLMEKFKNLLMSNRVYILEGDDATVSSNWSDVTLTADNFIINNIYSNKRYNVSISKNQSYLW